MEERAAPPVTITGGPGWAVAGRSGEQDDGNGDVVGKDATPRPPRRPTPRRRQLLALVAAAAVGFAGAQLLAERRQDALLRSPSATLSLEVVEDEPVPSYVNDDRGRLTLALPLALSNTGAADVVLETARLEGAGLRDVAVAGRSVQAGRTTRVVLVRRISCEQLPDAGQPAGPLLVTARTPAGMRSAELSLGPAAAEQVIQQQRDACGLISPGRALQFDVSVSQIRDEEVRLPLELRNASAQELLVQRVQQAEGLDLQLLDAAGAPVPLPLTLPAVEGVLPRQPFPATGPSTRLTAVLRLTDCGQGPDDDSRAPRPLLDVEVAGADDGVTENVAYGDGVRQLRRLRDEVCSAAEQARG